MHNEADLRQDHVRGEAAWAGPFRRARQLIGAAALFALWGIGTAACKNEDAEVGVPPASEKPEVSVPPPSVGPYDACTVDADCGFGEISTEIDDGEDCPCLYGCPFLPLGKVTIERRQSQYEGLCDPHENGNGEACGVDDCAAPPSPACVAGKCTAAAGD